MITKAYADFLEKETPAEGGCMLCQTTNKEGRVEYFLVERHETLTVPTFTVNNAFYFDYDFLWDDAHPWEIIYKKNV